MDFLRTAGVQLPMIPGASATSRIRIHAGAFHAKTLLLSGESYPAKTAYVFAVNFRFRGTDFPKKPLK